MKSDRSTRRWIAAGALGGGLLAAGLFAWLEWAVPREDVAGVRRVEEATWIGREAYADRLRTIAGQSIEPEALEALARDAVRSIGSRLAEVSRQIDPAADWRLVASRLLEDHPADAAAVLALYRDEVARAEAFVLDRDLVPWPPPNAPATARSVEVVEIRNEQFRRYFSLAMYLDGRLAVTVSPAGEEGGDEYLRNHCRTCVPPLAVHETWPGHHVAFAYAGPDSGRPTEPERVVFHEGWGLYAERLVLDLGYYDDDPARELGAWRFLYLRALRAWIDPALHAGTLDEAEALELYQREGLLTAEAARAEIARHRKDPGLKASYFLGLRQILALRRLVGVDVDDPASLRAFHARFLGEPRPIPEVARERFGVAGPIDLLAEDLSTFEDTSPRPDTP